MFRTTKKRLIFVLLLAVLLCAAVGAGFLFRPHGGAAAETYFGYKKVETLRQTDPAEIAALEKYSSRDYSIVTPVKNQGGYSLCWAFATMAASETSILREGVGGAVQSAFFGLEERTLAYRAHNPHGDPFHLIDDDLSPGDGSWDKGGYVEVAGKTMLQWMGPTRSRDYTGDQAVAADYPLAYKLEDMVTVKYSVEDVKRLVAEYGAAAFSFPIHTYESGYYNIDTYFNNTGQTERNPHACAIIGWDDTIPASKFKPIPSTGNGGWLVKNSWGKTAADEGYFYLSYDSRIYDIWAFDYTKADAFDNQYLYDGTLSRGNVSVYGENGVARAAAIFCAQGGTSEFAEEINAVNIGVGGKDVDVHVSVYKGLNPNYGYPSSPDNDPEAGTLVAEASKRVARDGFYTVYLDRPVRLENGESFSVVAEAGNADGSARILASQEYASSNDMTFEYKKGGWSNLDDYGGYCAHVRAYTKNVARTEAVDRNDLRFAAITLAEREFVYTGEAHTPEAIVTLGGAELQEGRDYELRYENNLNALGKACAVAEGRGEYSGTCRAYFRIARAKKPPNTPVKDREDPIVVGYEITNLGQIPLPEGWEWYYKVDLTKHPCDEPMEWTIKFPVTDGNYETNGYDEETGERYIQAGVYVLRESVRHDLLSLADAEIAVQGTYFYTGKAVVPRVTVKLNGNILVENVHYAVKCSAVQAGRAAATVEGISNYTGSKSFEFEIQKAQEPPALDPLGEITLAEGMETLDDVALPAYWRWVDGGTPLLPGTLDAVCEYAGADAGNYAVLTREVTLRIVASSEPEPDPEPEPEPDPEPDDGKEQGGGSSEQGGNGSENTGGGKGSDGENTGEDSGESDGKGGLSAGAIAGIAAAGGVTAASAGAFVIFAVRRRL